MRIAFDHQIFGHHRYGGIARYLYEIASGIAANHQQSVTIVSPVFVNDYLLHSPPELRIYGKSMPEFRGSAKLYRSLNRLLARPLMHALAPDIVHETYYSHAALGPRTAKVILTVHDMAHERLPHMFPADGTASAKAAAVARADHIICVSENTRRDLIELLNVAPNKTTVVHHGFSLTGKPLELAKVRASKRPFLLYVGHRGEYKNFSGMLKALARSVNLKKEFDIVCFGGGPLTTSELDLIRKSGLADEQVSQVSGNDDVLATLYKHASVFVYPSLYEGFGIPLLEAMSFDVPVACSNTSSLPEVVGNAALTFDPTFPEAIGAAIESILTNSELRADLVKKGRVRLNQFSWERCTAETLDTYVKALL